jgi:hypothetical protein
MYAVTIPQNQVDHSYFWYNNNRQSILDKFHLEDKDALDGRESSYWLY